MNDETPVAVISGANRGIGLEAARQLAEQGYRVIIGSRDEQKGHEAAEGLDGAVEARQLDVSDPESVERFAQGLEGEVDHVDALINNAGVIGDTGRRGADADLDEVKGVLETNLFGAWRLTQALAPLLEKSGHGRVVNISSGMGQLSDMNGGAPSYRVSKTALNALTRIFANELGGVGREGQLGVPRAGCRPTWAAPGPRARWTRAPTRRCGWPPSRRTARPAASSAVASRSTGEDSARGPQMTGTATQAAPPAPPAGQYPHLPPGRADAASPRKAPPAPGAPPPPPPPPPDQGAWGSDQQYGGVWDDKDAWGPRGLRACGGAQCSATKPSSGTIGRPRSTQAAIPPARL
ncbi:MAG: SDR family NAD(P)-dependent oxidoreductase [Thermoleophilaceae bacterium]